MAAKRKRKRGAEPVATPETAASAPPRAAPGNAQAPCLEIRSEDQLEEDVNARYNGWTTLMFAAHDDNAEFVRTLLVSPRLDVNLCEPSSGYTALGFAASLENVGALSELLKHPSIDVNAGNNADNLSALDLAAAYNRAASVAKLLEDARQRGTIAALVNDVRQTQCVKGMTYLMAAAFNGHLEVMQALAVPECDVNVRDEIGNTALMYAVEGGHLACVRALLRDPRCTVDLVNDEGETAVMIAIRLQRSACIKALDKPCRIAFLRKIMSFEPL